MPLPVGDGTGQKLRRDNGLAHDCPSGDYLGKVFVHEKAVPAMMGYYNEAHHGGTADGQRKEAGSPAAAGQVVDRLDAGVSHTGRFQASAKGCSLRNASIYAACCMATWGGGP